MEKDISIKHFIEFGLVIPEQDIEQQQNEKEKENAHKQLHSLQNALSPFTPNGNSLEGLDKRS